MQDDIDPMKRKYRVFLVTARHVVSEFEQQHPGIPLSVRLNPDKPGIPAKEFQIDQKKWFLNRSPGADVAISPVNFGFLNSIAIHPVFFADDQFVANRAELKKIGVSEGDGVFVLGFPMNLAGEQRNYVIVRRGGIARIAEMLDKVSPTFMLDAFVFPGNSGSPVITKPDVNAIQGTLAQTRAYLIGMVISYRAYNDYAVSTQTHQLRIVFSENSGLAEVLPTDAIEDTIDQWRFSLTGAPPVPP